MLYTSIHIYTPIDALHISTLVHLVLSKRIRIAKPFFTKNNNNNNNNTNTIFYQNLKQQQHHDGKSDYLIAATT